jgi:hypothetical protein
MEMNLQLEEKKKWNDEHKSLKEEKKRLEYTLFDLFKDSDKKQGEDKDDSANL